MSHLSINLLLNLIASQATPSTFVDRTRWCHQSPVTASVLARTDLAHVFSLAFCLFSSHSTVFPVLPTSLLPITLRVIRQSDINFYNRSSSSVPKNMKRKRLRGLTHFHSVIRYQRV